jgi:hypothetical protein
MSPTFKNALLLIFAIVPGISIAVIAGYYALIDWAALKTAYRTFEHAAAIHAPLPDLIAAESFQNIHRINLFADGVWTLLGLILFTLGITGWRGKQKSVPQT